MDDTGLQMTGASLKIIFPAFAENGASGKETLREGACPERAVPE